MGQPLDQAILLLAERVEGEHGVIFGELRRQRHKLDAQGVGVGFIPVDQSKDVRAGARSSRSGESPRAHLRGTQA